MKLPILVTACSLAAALCAGAQIGTQEITLNAGWNAVWLDVEPVVQAGPDAGEAMPPEDVFNHAAIELVATPKPLAGLAEFFAADPLTAGSFNQDEWQRWRRLDPSGSNNLPLVPGNRPFLIEVGAATPTFTLTVVGRARFFRPTWVPDRYNLVGFALEGTPTFGAFFGPAGARHPISRIRRLSAAGSWQAVTPTQAMASHEAYWIFANGPSTFMGPVAVDFNLASAGILNFGGASDVRRVGSGADELSLDLQELLLTNLGAVPAVPAMDFIAADVADGDLALHVVQPVAANLAYERGAQLDATPGVGDPTALGESVAAQGTGVVTLGAQRLWTSGVSGRTNLYRLNTGGGSRFWLPVSAQLSQLVPPADLLPADGGEGLWVGDVKVGGATSLVETNPVPTSPPVRATAGTAPLRVLLHSDAGGAVRLLSQITIMQTRTADPEIPAVQVLVTDPAKIPFFEGVAERQGKLVGIRVATVGYDMPRDTSVAAQGTGSGDLIDAIVAESGSPTTRWSGRTLYPDRASVTPEAIDSYLQFRSTRPPSLKESYHLNLPMDGAVGAGKTVRTTPGSLVLDPFHRSNPFRHAFHQSEARGPQIAREFEIIFDADQPAPDVLLGSWRETIAGLTKETLTVTGTVELRRLSPVPVLDSAP